MNDINCEESKLPSVRTIYTFWEPKNQLIPYLKLCKKTWDINLPNYKIITLDYSNYYRYIDPTILDFSTLRNLPLMIQKDAFMVAVLHQNGGLFIDLDTIVLDDITPIIDCLDYSDVVMFNTHLACVAARAGSTLLSVWLSEIQNKLSDLRMTKRIRRINWDFLGNSVLRDSMDVIMKTKLLSVMTLNSKDNRLNEIAMTMISVKKRGSTETYSRIKNSLASRWRMLFFRTILRRNLLMLDRQKYGFIQEACYFKDKKMSAREKYLQFWFVFNINPIDVINNNIKIIGLHNSWTPDWYKALSEEEILEHDCLLSKTLNYILQGKRAIE